MIEQMRTSFFFQIFLIIIFLNYFFPYNNKYFKYKILITRKSHLKIYCTIKNKLNNTLNE